MRFERKILSLVTLGDWRRECRDRGVRVVATNGCFDLLHLGHVTYLEGAREQGDALVIGVNGDEGVRALKGPGRPINDENARAGVLAALESVSRVLVFPGSDACAFLEAARPDVYVKGGDYSVDTMHPGERAVLESAGARIVFIPLVQGKSTTRLIRRIHEPGQETE